MENLRRRVNVKIVTDENIISKLTFPPTYENFKIFNKSLTVMHRIKEALILNKPAYVGMCILDFSKTLMYDFHYNYILKKGMAIEISYYSLTQTACIMK